MTEGTSQGLFVVVAIVIFGIFIGLTYTLFGSEGLSNDLKGIFGKGIEQGFSKEEESGFKVTYTENSDGTYTILAKTEDATKFTPYSINLISDNKGVNLLPNSDFKLSLTDAMETYPDMIYTYRGGTSIVQDKETTIAGTSTLKIDFSKPLEQGPDDASIFSGHILKDEEDVTISFDAYSLEDTVLNIRLGVIGMTTPAYQRVSLTPSLNRYSITLKKKSYFNNHIAFSSNSKTFVYLTNLQVEYGTVDTDYKNSIEKTENSMTVIAKEKGLYTFKTTDKEGKQFTESIDIQ